MSFRASEQRQTFPIRLGNFMQGENGVKLGKAWHIAVTVTICDGMQAVEYLFFI